MKGKIPILASLAEAQIEASPFPTLITRVEDGVMVHVNESGHEAILSGYGVSDPIGKSVFDLDYHTSKEARMAIIDEARRNGGHLRRNDVIAGGQLLARMTSTHVFELDGVEYTVAVLVDISETLVTESALAKALERLEKAQALAKTGDFVFDLSSGEFSFSKEALRILQLPKDAENVSVKSILSRVHEDDKATLGT